MGSCVFQGTFEFRKMAADAKLLRCRHFFAGLSGKPEEGAGSLDRPGWAAALGSWGDVSGWFASQVVAPVIGALTPARTGDWVTDRVARHPSGRQSRTTYRDPLFHYPNFRVILEELALTPNDVLLDVGCGGGAL